MSSKQAGRFARRTGEFAFSLMPALALACGNAGRTPVGVNDPNDPAPVFTVEQQATLAALSPEILPGPPPDVSNLWADEPSAAHFGQKLFFESEISGQLLDGDNDGTVNALGNKGDTGKVACSGCHLPESSFTDTRTIRRQISLGAGWGKRKAPSLLDVGQSTLLMWDGRRDALYNQIFGVIESPVEMNSSRLYAAQRVFARYRAEYETLFGSMPPLDDATRFPALAATEVGCRKLDSKNACVQTVRGVPGDGAEYDAMTPEDQTAVTRVMVNVGKAIGAYERLLTCGQSRFDHWVHGDSMALSRAEQRGALLFVDRGGCVKCHSGAYLSDEKFHNVGLKAELVATVFLDDSDPGASQGLRALKDDPLNVHGSFSDGDDGRIPETLGSEFDGAFRTPRLRCVAQRPSFMHTAQMVSLDAVVAFFDRGGDIGGFPGTNELTKLGFTPRDRADLIAFLQALDGPGPAEELLASP